MLENYYLFIYFSFQCKIPKLIQILIRTKYGKVFFVLISHANVPNTPSRELKSKLRVHLLWGDGEGEMESHSISLLFLYLDKFYKNRNRIKSNSDGNKLLLLSRIFSDLTFLTFLKFDTLILAK